MVSNTLHGWAEPGWADISIGSAAVFPEYDDDDPDLEPVVLLSRERYYELASIEMANQQEDEA